MRSRCCSRFAWPLPHRSLALQILHPHCPFHMEMTTATIHNTLQLSAHWLNRNCPHISPGRCFVTVHELDNGCDGGAGASREHTPTLTWDDKDSVPKNGSEDTRRLTQNWKSESRISRINTELKCESNLWTMTDPSRGLSFPEEWKIIWEKCKKKKENLSITKRCIWFRHRETLSDKTQGTLMSTMKSCLQNVRTNLPCGREMIFLPSTTSEKRSLPWRVLKTTTKMLRHRGSHRKDDGPIDWNTLLPMYCRDFENASEWTNPEWLDLLRTGSDKTYFSIDWSQDGLILYMRANQGHSGGAKVDPTLLDNVGHSLQIELIPLSRRLFPPYALHCSIRIVCKGEKKPKTNCFLHRPGSHEWWARGRNQDLSKPSTQNTHPQREWRTIHSVHKHAGTLNACFWVKRDGLVALFHLCAHEKNPSSGQPCHSLAGLFPHLLPSSLPQHAALPGQRDLLQEDTVSPSQEPIPKTSANAIRSETNAKESLWDPEYESAGNLRINTPTGYHSARNQFERFRGFWELISRFEFEFRRRWNYIFFEGFEFLVCSKFNHTRCGL